MNKIKENIIDQRKKQNIDFLYKMNLIKYKKWMGTFLQRGGNKKSLQLKISKNNQNQLKKKMFSTALLQIFDMYEQPILIKEKIISKKKKNNFFQLQKQNKTEKRFFKVLQNNLLKKQNLKIKKNFLPFFLSLSSKQQDSWEQNKKYFQNLGQLWEENNNFLKKDDLGEEFDIDDKYFSSNLEKITESNVNTILYLKVSTYDKSKITFFIKNLKIWLTTIIQSPNFIIKLKTIALPVKSKKITLLKSPHVNKTAQNQYELVQYQNLCIFSFQTKNLNKVKAFFYSLSLLIQQYANLNFKIKIKKNN